MTNLALKITTLCDPANLTFDQKKLTKILFAIFCKKKSLWEINSRCVFKVLFSMCMLPNSSMLQHKTHWKQPLKNTLILISLKDIRKSQNMIIFAIFFSFVKSQSYNVFAILRVKTIKASVKGSKCLSEGRFVIIPGYKYIPAGERASDCCLYNVHSIHPHSLM